MAGRYDPVDLTYIIRDDRRGGRYRTTREEMRPDLRKADIIKIDRERLSADFLPGKVVSSGEGE
jgi:hypothetical protein